MLRRECRRRMPIPSEPVSHRTGATKRQSISYQSRATELRINRLPRSMWPAIATDNHHHQPPTQSL